jgi:DNA-binding winged helix-turn-helix (wHTH) protein
MTTPVTPAPAFYRYRFGTAEFDEARFELRVGGLLVDVQQKPLQLLALLIRVPGQTIDRESILDSLWGRHATGDAILANAASKLRTALGDQNHRFIVTVPRRGYRFEGTLDRIAVGRQQDSRLELKAGEPAPDRKGYVLESLLHSNESNETWRVAQTRTGERRVMKFAANGEQLANLKREVTIFRILRESTPSHEGYVQILDWNFEHTPFWIESVYSGPNLVDWAEFGVPGGPRLAQIPRGKRIDLLLAIIDATAAAHEAGVLHKDIKPTNILIDGNEILGWRPRLADFGSGWIMDAERIDALGITRLGLTVASDASSDSGTPFYLAPELLAGQAPGIRSDLYSLGVLAFQLLAGNLRRPMMPGWERDIGDPLLCADLARATDVDPAMRFGSLSEFGERLRKLEERRAQIEADSAAVAHSAQVHKRLSLAQARRPWIIASVATLCGGLVLATGLYLRAEHARDLLNVEYQSSAALNTLLREDIIAAANPSVSGQGGITVAEALARAADQVDRRFAGTSAVTRARLHAAMQSALSELSRSKEAVQAGERAVAAWKQSSVANTEELQDARLRLAVDLVQLSQLDAAAQVVKDVEKDSLNRPLDDEAKARLFYAKSWITSGDFALQESTDLMEQAHRLVEQPAASDEGWRDKILFGLADNYTLLGRNVEAEQLFRSLHESQTARLGPNHARPYYTLVGQARAVMNQNRLQEASALLERASAGLGATVGPQHRQTLSARDFLAEIKFKRGEYAAAASEWRTVHAGFSHLLGAGSSYALTVQTSLGAALHLAGHSPEAEQTLRDALQRARQFAANDTPQVQQIRYQLARCLLDQYKRAGVAELLAGLNEAALNLAQQEPDWPARLNLLRERLRKSGG